MNEQEPSDQLPSEQKMFLSELASVRDALGLLKRHRLPTSVLESEIEARLEEIRRQPTEADKRWPLDVPEEIGEHIKLGDDRPVLSTRMSVGRAYSLTPGQRDVLRDRYGFTPARLVEVHEVALFPETRLVKRVTLCSSEHVPSTRRHLVVRCAIEDWGVFCDTAKQRDVEREELKKGTDVLADEASEPTSTSAPKAGNKVQRVTKTFQQLVDEYAV